MRQATKNLIGQKFGKLTIWSLHSYREDGDYTKYGKAWAISKCDCGGFAFTPLCNLKNGNTKSCGCSREIGGHTTHGHSAKGTQTPTYTSWRCMKARCDDPNNNRYHNYGGRGITYCDRWAKFENFLQDVGERPDGTTLDRINPNGNYEPGNVRWATPKQQANNRRNSRANKEACHASQVCNA